MNIIQTLYIDNSKDPVRRSVKRFMFGIASFAMSKLKARLCLAY